MNEQLRMPEDDLLEIKNLVVDVKKDAREAQSLCQQLFENLNRSAENTGINANTVLCARILKILKSL